jgi:hypothetical protein
MNDIEGIMRLYALGELERIAKKLTYLTPESLLSAIEVRRVEIVQECRKS